MERRRKSRIKKSGPNEGRKEFQRGRYSREKLEVGSTIIMRHLKEF